MSTIQEHPELGLRTHALNAVTHFLSMHSSSFDNDEAQENTGHKKLNKL
jgi:hypothetical protein